MKSTTMPDLVRTLLQPTDLLELGGLDVLDLLRLLDDEGLRDLLAVYLRHFLVEFGCFIDIPCLIMKRNS